MTTGSDGKPRRWGAALQAGRFRLALGLGLALMATGCQHLPFGRELPGDDAAQNGASEPETPPETPSQVRGRQLAALMDYYRGVKMAPRAVLEERSAYLKTLVTDGACDPWRLKYAMVTRALVPPGEIEQATKLLTVCLGADSPDHHGVGAFASLLEELWETEAVSVRYRQQLQATRRKLDNEQAETAKLRKQLEGLKAIEQSIQQRDRDQGASGSQ